MATKTTPFGLALQYGEDLGANFWNVWADQNTTRIGMLTQIAVETVTNSLPVIEDGKRYIRQSTGELVADLDGGRNYFTPFAGLRVYVKDVEQCLFYDGTTWLDEDDYGVMG